MGLRQPWRKCTSGVFDGMIVLIALARTLYLRLIEASKTNRKCHGLIPLDTTQTKLMTEKYSKFYLDQSAQLLKGKKAKITS